GWAKQFLLAGAGAFVGAYWSVYDEAAYNFARELYNRLLAGKPIAQAAREARLAIKSTGDPTGWHTRSLPIRSLQSKPESALKPPHGDTRCGWTRLHLPSTGVVAAQRWALT